MYQGSSSGRIRTCPICNREIKPVSVIIFGQKRLMPTACQCEIKRMEEDMRRVEQEQKRSKIVEIFNQSRLGPRLRNASFENFEQLPGTQAAYREAVRFVRDKLWMKHDGLLIYGKPGNGKSHLAAAVVNAAVSMDISALMLNVPELMTQIKATYRVSRYTEADILYWVAEADLVVLDDLGAENLTGNTYEVIYKIINTLYNKEKSLIVTTNLDVERELPDAIGPRIYDRLLEMCRIIENTGWSYRRRIAAQRMEVK